MSEEILDGSGHLIGKIYHESDRDRLIDSSGSLAGIYYYDSDETRDSSGSLVGKGNQLMRCLR